LPYIDDDGTVVADSTFIRLHLEKRYRIDLDAGFSAEQRARAWAIERLVEDQLYWATVYLRWAVDENFDKGPAHFFDRLPEEVQPAARRRQREAVLGYLHGQGFGRHNVAEIAKLAELGYAALAELLGAQPYLLGDRPCGADASVFGQLASVLTPWFDSPVREAAQAHRNLRDYTQRMMAAYFPAYAHS
jgi:glutathione S-transferase